jgi:DNA-directed RNA polymerase subunit RPC12/RpoP
MEGKEMSNTYKCAACGETFESEISDEEALQESKTLWGDMDMADLVVICDTCFNRGKDEALIEHHAGKVRN